MKRIKFKYMTAAVLCGFLMTAAITVSGCGGKYEDITLGMQPGAGQESSLEDGTSESTTGAGDITGSSEDGSADAVGTAEGGAEGSLVPGEDGGISSISLDSGEEVALQNEQTGQAVAEDSLQSSSQSGAPIAGTGFTDIDETVYISQNAVNLRFENNTASRIVVQLSEGDSVKRTGYSDEWSRVVYKDNICYVSSAFVTTAKPGGDNAGDIMALANTANAAAQAEAVSAQNGRIVAIDAGHQAKGDSEKEPIGPGSSTMKAKVATGTEGVSTKLPEYKLTLAVSQKLKRILEERGYKVIMIRETHDVNISNAERAKTANKSGASIFVRVHANSLDNSTVAGVLTMCQTSGNPYNGELHDKSYALSRKITDSISTATGFKNRGVQETDTMSGINWCTIPVSIVEMGFLSNPEEDQKLAQDEYQEKVAGGIADGIDAYFAE